LSLLPLALVHGSPPAGGDVSVVLYRGARQYFRLAALRISLIFLLEILLCNRSGRTPAHIPEVGSAAY